MPLEPVESEYRGEVAMRYRYRDGSGEVGVIASVTKPFCGDCTRSRLSTDGAIYTCLFSGKGVSLRDPMRAGADDEELRSLIAGVWGKRLDRYSEERAELTAAQNASRKVEMYQIGGVMAGGAVIIYTDGACLGNPGPGGYGVVLLSDGNRKELSGGFRETTNNRMELMAAIVGLEALNDTGKVTLYSDSKYVVDAMAKGWAKRWRTNGWMRNRREAALNPDLWERLLTLAEGHQVDFRWVRGHRGVVENERVDRLATTAARGRDLPPDRGYQGSGR